MRLARHFIDYVEFDYVGVKFVEEKRTLLNDN